ncbi:MAG: hypothetical protein HW406_1514 [Candidatus Brocadiaceae bacterium]|nr:hypothetical protein [Candidatus Brocadiaceae bacterium]MBM2834353.1 hypothetical protein [Candidatus Brocadiaceae bacterium]
MAYKYKCRRHDIFKIRLFCQIYHPYGTTATSLFIFYQYIVPNGTLRRINYATDRTTVPTGLYDLFAWKQAKILHEVVSILL